jgi:23S rRNA G2069 N7-methylase RlmK/C1962 C5-methylase RlmI
LKQKANQDKKYITFEKEILSITRTISKKEMVNKYYLSGQGVAEATYSDPTYINLFKLKEKTVTDSSILDITTRDTKGNEFIAEKKLEDNIVTIRIAPNSIDLVP